MAQFEQSLRHDPKYPLWGRFVHWAARLHSQPQFDEWERHYKIDIAERLTAARDAVLAGREWLQPLRTAFRRDNNLTSWQVNDRFLKWCEAHANAARDALVGMWKEGLTVEQRVYG